MDGSIKFSEFSKTWLQEYAIKQLRATTVFTYETMLEKRNEIIGHLRVDKIQPHHLLQCYDKLKGTEKETSYFPLIDFNSYIASNYNSKAEFARACDVSNQVVASICAQKAISAISVDKICKETKTSQKQAVKPSATGKALSNKTILN